MTEPSRNGAGFAPIVERPGESPASRLLLISYHFPPGDATGALRWQRLATHAAERGWGLDVVAAAPGSLSQVDWKRVEELPPGTRVWGVDAGPSLLERSVSALARAWNAVRRRGQPQTPSRDTRETGESETDAKELEPDPSRQLVFRHELERPRPGLGALRRAYEVRAFFAREGAWARAATRAGRHVVDPDAHRAVVSCGPPHMAHDAARRVARHAGLPCIMDMRDPWSLTPALPSSMATPLYYRLAERYEGRAVAAAALVVSNTETHRIALQARYPAAHDRVISVMNGIDDDPIPPSERDGRFSVAYAGNIYIDRDPRPLFRAARDVVEELELTPDRFGIDLLGHVDQYESVPVAALARDAGLDQYVRILPRRPRREALAFLAGSTMLLSLPQDVDLSIPSKIFEYMQFEAWVLALAREGSATEIALRGTGADVVDPGDEPGIAAAIRSRVRQFERGERPGRLADDNPRLTRRAQARKLFDAIANVTDQRTGNRDA